MNNITFSSAETPKSFSETNAPSNQKPFGILQVPIYQRLFVWGEKEIGLLLDDLYHAYKENPNVPYYIGIFTFVKKIQSENEQQWDIVDGQQRLTFLTLFGAYVHDENWKKFVFLNGNESQLRIHYFGRPEDMEDIRQIWNKLSNEVRNPNFRTFIDCISSRKETWKKDWNGYCNYVYQQASFLISKLPGEYDSADLNRFFEKMNAAGRQLTPVEQIKSKYFSQFSVIFDACLNFEKQYTAPLKTGSESDTSSGWTLKSILDDSQTAVEPEPPEDDSTDRYMNRAILRPAIFLLHVLKIVSTGQEISLNENKLLETFNNHKTDPACFIEKMIEYRTWLDENIIFLKCSDRDSFEYTFRSDDTNEDEPQNELVQEKLRQFQSMLYVSSSDSQQWVLEIYQETAEHKVDLQLLKQQDKKRHENLPDLSLMKYNSIDRYWFWKLDYILWELYLEKTRDELFAKLNADEKDAIAKYRFKSNRSIEHLHPQTDTNSPIQWDSCDKDCFGNLAMISSSFNSLQQNDSVGVKFARLKDAQIPKRTLESIKMLLMFANAERQESGWTPEKAQKHGEAMYQLLKQFHEQKKEEEQA